MFSHFYEDGFAVGAMHKVSSLRRQASPLHKNENNYYSFRIIDLLLLLLRQPCW